MKTSSWVSFLLIFIGGGVWAQTPTPTSLPGCCLQASGWTQPTLAVGSGVAVDRPLHRVYVTDQTNGVVRAFNYDGTSATAFGGGTGQVAVSMVFGVAAGPCDHPGVYAVTRSYSPSTVTKFDSDGHWLWTSPPLPDGGAFLVSVDDQGNSYVSSGYGHIYVLDPDGNPKATITGTGSWTLNSPIGLFNQGLDLYVADSANNRFLQFTQTGVNTYSYTPVMAVTVAPLSPYGLTRGLDGHFYAAFQNSSGYQVYDTQFQPVAPFCAQGVLLGSFGISTDETGAIYLATHWGTQTVVKMQACFNQPAFYNCYPGADPPQRDQCFVYPSPARGDHATVSYSMASQGQMDMKIFNENGELAAVITDHKPSGTQITPFNLAPLASGVYYYVLTLSYDSGQVTKLKAHKFVVLR